MSAQVTKNSFGFYQLANVPSSEDLEEYYARKYYQEAAGSYEISYSDDEINYINNKLEQKYQIISDFFNGVSLDNKTFLDIGCGEGWALRFFKDKSWDVLGIDYSEFGCISHNKEISKYMIAGDIYNNMNELINDGKRYHLIWLDNVLEHVSDPLDLLKKCRLLIEDHGIMVIEVPNDFSIVQEYLLGNMRITRPYWIVEPDHISYFNREGLISLSNAAGWDCLLTMGDFPIEFNLFNSNTNYIEDKSKGKACHHARIEIENFLHQISLSKTNKLYALLGSMGIGRQIIAFFRKG